MNQVAIEFSKNTKKVLQQPISTLDIIYKVVDHTTIRAFHKKRDYNKYKPLSIFRFWAYDSLCNNAEKIDLISKCECFNTIHDFFYKDLHEYWFTVEKMKLQEYKVYKLVDLFFKGVTSWENISMERREFFMKNVNCPLDMFVLQYLKQHSSFSLAKSIKDNSSMSFIKDKNYYDLCQKEIRKLCEELNISPYVFDEIALQPNQNANRFPLPPVLVPA